MKPMKYLIYLSSAVGLMDSDELMEILKVSRVNNTRDQITGVLLYSAGSFVQLLEGEEDVVKGAYHRIMTDPRHRGIIKIAEGNLEKRNFPEWAMGFKSADRQELEEFKGFIDPGSKTFLNEKEAHPAIVLLKTFVDINRLSDTY